MLFDSHTHLNEDSFSSEERKLLMDGIKDSELLKYVADIGYDLKSSKLAAKHAMENPWCVAAVGVHPHDSGSMTESSYEEIKKHSAQEGVNANGEI